MQVLYFLLLLLALVCLLAAAFGVTTRVSLLALGLALWVAVPFIQAAAKL